MSTIMEGKIEQLLLPLNLALHYDLPVGTPILYGSHIYIASHYPVTMSA